MRVADLQGRVGRCAGRGRMLARMAFNTRTGGGEGTSMIGILGRDTRLFRQVCRLAVVGWIALLAGVALASDDDAFDGFMSPVSNPVNFEDPRSTTEVRPLYVYHKISSDFARNIGGPGVDVDGGDAHVVAVQARLAITDRLAFIATKDGYVWLRPKNVLENTDGWANIALGGKYTFFRDPDNLLLATIGLRYEIPSGNQDVFQGFADGVFNPFLSGAWGVENLAGLGDFHVLGYIGTRLPVNGGDTSFFDLSVHADWGLELPWGDDRIHPLVELNWVQGLDGGKRFNTLDQEGFDFFNLGSRGAGGEGVVTMAVGARYRIFDDLGEILGRTVGLDIGAAWEAPVTSRQDLFGWRVTTDMILWMR